jgi:hypothetical protein
MRLAALRDWDTIEIVDVAREAGVTLSEFRDAFPSKGAVLAGFSRMIDTKVLAGTTDDLAGEAARERVFDVHMRRFDALTPYKPALRRIAKAFRRDPAGLAALNRVAVNSQRFMLAAAGVSTEGPLGNLKVQGSVLVFTKALDTWLSDDDPSTARTMAVLDRELKRGERVLQTADDCRRLTAPFRAFGRALFEGRNRTKPSTDAEAEAPAAAI